MKSDSSDPQVWRVLSNHRSEIAAIAPLDLTVNRSARSTVRLSLWLLPLILGLGSASVAHAAMDSPLKTAGTTPEKSDVVGPKSSPASRLAFDFATLSDLPIRPSIHAPEAASTAIATTNLQDINVNAAEPAVTTSEDSDTTYLDGTLQATETRNSEVTFEFPDADQLTGTFTIDLADSEGLKSRAIAPSADDVIEAPEAIAQATDSAEPYPWRFTVEPFFYVPFGVNGDITVRGINASIDAGPGDIFDTIVNDLNFAAFGEIEAWKGPWGIFFTGAYTDLGTGRTENIPVPPVLQQVGIPPQLSVSAAAGTSFFQLDLGGAYRFGDGNLPTALRTADTEFDLGPFIFDAQAGLRLYSFNNELVLTGPRGNQFEFDQSNTIVEPMIGGRARWNVSDNLAALAGGSMSGFGIGGLTFSVAGYGGIDWLFSGNTSLTALYRFTYLEYSSGNSGLDLFTHGPNVGVKFRF